MTTATIERAIEVIYERPWMADYQTAAIFCSERYGIVEASTKSGKTVGCLAWLIEQALAGEEGQNFWWVAPIFRTSKIAFRRAKRGFDPDLFVANETESTLTFANGAVIWFLGADDPDSLYGEDVYAAVIDEATRFKEESWHAIRTTLTATRGPLRIIGNVKGRRNWAYKLARKAEAGHPGMHYAKVTARDAVKAGVLSQAEIDDARGLLPADVYGQLYDAEPNDDSGNPFGFAAIKAAISPMHLECRPFVWGWDFARSNDWVVGIALCAHAAVCRFHRWNQSNLPGTKVQNPVPGDANEAYWKITIATARSLTADTPAMNDSTGPGGPLDQALNAGRIVPNFEGYVYTNTSKQMLMEGMAVAIQSREITYPEGRITVELDAFEYVYTRTGVRYSAPEGEHDDCVCALAMARLKWIRARAGQAEAKGMAAMIRGGQVVRVVPDGVQQPADLRAEWMRNLR